MIFFTFGIQGHAAPVLYAAWAETGLFPEEDLLKLRKIDCDLEGHPTPVSLLSLMQHYMYYLVMYFVIIFDSVWFTRSCFSCRG